MFQRKRITKLGGDWLRAELLQRSETERTFRQRDRTATLATRCGESPAALDNLEPEERLNAQRVKRIRDDLSGNPEFVDLPTQTSMVAFGHIVTALLYDGVTSRTTRVMVDGYSHDLGADFIVVNAMTSDLAQAVLGLAVGDSDVYTVRGRVIEVTIVKIELPSRRDLRVFAGKRARTRPMATAA